jgi:hypothetical protein
MGIFSKIGTWVGNRIGDGPSISGLKSSIRGTGNLVSKAAPLVSLVNPLLGAGLKVGGELAGGRNIGEAALSGAKTYGVGKLAGAIPGVGKLGDVARSIPGASSVLGGGGGATLPGPLTTDDMGRVIGGAASGGGGFGDLITGGLKSVGKFALDNPDLIAGGLAGYHGFKAGQQEDDLRQQAIRAMTERPDLSHIFADAGNPYNRYAQKAKATGVLARPA